MSEIFHFENIKNNIDFKLEWENEVLTEFKSYQFIKNLKHTSANYILPLNYIAYPWALLIDYYIIKYKSIYPSFYHFIKEIGLIDQLSTIKNNCITVVQSYHFKKYLNDFKKIGIKYIFSPHITKNDFLQIFYTHNIVVFPYYIFPSITSKNKLDKDILYNFVGNTNYSIDRPTSIRNNIVQLNHPDNCYVKKLDEWHFNNSIYCNQLNLLKNNDDISNNDISNNKLSREDEYRHIMGSSIFSICPLGIGPNSIRLWESFTYNTIPVSISDDLWFPFYMDVKWDHLIVNIKEHDYKNILELNNIKKEQIADYQENIETFYDTYFAEDSFGSIMLDAFKPYDKINLLMPWFNHDDTNSLRYQEIHICLEKNLQNNKIKQIIFFYEVDDVKNINYDLYNNPKIKIIPVITQNKREISFNRIARFANENLINEICIISNNDIYFDNTLNNISKLDFYKYNYFISLTRKNCDNYLDNKDNMWKPHSGSQDSWIFVSPIKLMNNEINLGWVQCDNIISESYHSLGYNVINPHYSINSWHLHKFNITNFLLDNFNYNYKFKMRKIPLKSISDIIDSSVSNEYLILENIDTNINTNIDTNTNNRINISKLGRLKEKWLKKI